jgi:hypothetical protein
MHSMGVRSYDGCRQIKLLEGSGTARTLRSQVALLPSAQLSLSVVARLPKCPTKSRVCQVFCYIHRSFSELASKPGAWRCQC